MREALFQKDNNLHGMILQELPVNGNNINISHNTMQKMQTLLSVNSFMEPGILFRIYHNNNEKKHFVNRKHINLLKAEGNT